MRLPYELRLAPDAPRETVIQTYAVVLAEALGRTLNAPGEILLPDIVVQLEEGTKAFHSNAALHDALDKATDMALDATSRIRKERSN